MPEAAEVAINADWLRRRLVGKTLSSFRFHPHSRYHAELPPLLKKLTALANAGDLLIEAIESKGKLMWWQMRTMQSDPTIWMHISHGMTGGWREIGLDSHDAWSITYDACSPAKNLFHSRIVFYDARKFGTLHLYRNRQEHEGAVAKLGPDVLGETPSFVLGHVHHRAMSLCNGKRGDWSIRKVLMDQAMVSGLGNYLVNEVLYWAEIRPQSKFRDLTLIQLNRLFLAASGTAKDALSAGGCTLHTWRNPNGEPGRFQHQLQIYGKTTCPLGHPVTCEMDQAKRRVWWCPRCQR